ncbi:BCCT family transporter [Gammaproteobacteria bacterium]|nr:BCCT family transporter [Gammaproteobacteria bacterium]MDA9204351.1 BCCT family transporter [Gammaproteobacteria bacterium]MDB2666628.1 BCCT family transporter [Gammaproteobacteria bacterium]MDB4842805.1 BCCT family transporter [Gammaproteobacteria bacterium]MDB9840900.1 BCCT family transporter [Gammaproteobacteria bacterium]
MFKNIAPKRFLYSLFLISAFIGITLFNLTEADKLFSGIQEQLSNSLGWLIILAANAILVFVIYLAFSKHKNLILGGPDAKPEFSNINWIAMLFSAGLGIGLLFYGVAEPIMHLSSDAIHQEGATFSDQANLSMNLTYLHWGFHGWAIYGVVGLCFAYFSFNKNLPFRVSSFFSGALTQNAWGRVPLDIIAIIATIFGIATSLGLGANQINSGLGYMGVLEESFLTTVWIIAFITLLGLISVVLGLQTGIKRLSQLNMILCGLMLSIVFIAGPTSFIVDGLLQNVGSYIQNLLALSTNTQAYMDSSWQNGWTLFYYSWWFAWSPFVGLFIARISYGRSIQEFLLGVVVIPSILVFVWMGIFGNAALHQELLEPNSLSTAINNDITISLFVFLEQFPYSPILMGLSIVIILTFFVTSSDSGALVTSMLTAANNEKAQDEPPMLLRVVWAISLGIIAVVLLAGGGLGALQTSVIVTGVPFAILIFFACKSLLKSLNQ